MKNSLIFGSTALKHWFPTIDRVPKDLDIMVRFLPLVKNKGTEYHWAEGFQYVLDNNKDQQFVDPNFLYTIKVSHAAWDVRWDKTIHDIHLLQSFNCELDYTLYQLLLKDWEVIHSKKKIKLQGNAEEFFNKNITRKVKHDDLHELVKFYDRPLHERIRPKADDVYCSKDLWDKLEFEDQLKCALEETYVFALERYSDYPPKIAFTKALKQLITQSTKGYFNLFLIERFFDLLYYNKVRYLEFFKNYKTLISLGE